MEEVLSRCVMTFLLPSREKVGKASFCREQGRPLLPVFLLCSWRLDVRERVLAASNGQEAKLGPGELQTAKGSQSHQEAAEPGMERSRNRAGF